ncbi:Nucleotide/sugar transporter family protein [Raphanus sativus]|uniref:UDP-N-acetylglucosamine transporter UGNT1 n=1 Tax=Raphanus sativus TaxID=3726 RepID=A0A6J0N6F8_RAPSA|nr:UDP-N-acetylglucosamine transporter UGNT1 [Raphanus sativus]KAJ4899166.1 Nucleotide/sugar transporter family protein [Raphanus sativus]
MRNPVLPVSDPPLAGENDTDDRLFKGSAMTKRGAYAALSYMSCAVMLVLFNKAALSSYDFPCVNIITLFQMVSSTLFLYTLRRKKIISFTAGDSDNNVSAFVPLKTLFHTLPLSVAYLLYMLVTMASVRGVNVPMYTTLRRTTVAFTMVIEYMLTGQRYTRSIIGSVGVILFGAFFAGARDLSFDFYGYGVVFLANITTAVYLATISRTGKSSGLNSFGLMWCNGIICGPILMIWTYVCGDLERTINFPHLFSPGFMVVLLSSCVLAFFLNYCIFLNTTLNSAVTQTICGNMKDVFTVGLGWMFFGGLPFDLMNVIGQLFGFFGSGLYAYYKIIGR